MNPIVFPSRVDLPGGLWTPKCGGNFQEGDPATSSHVIQGKADIKELTGHLRLFCEEVTVIQRKIVLTEKQRQELTEEYREKNKTKKKQRQALGQEVSDSEDDDEEAKMLRKKREETALAQLFRSRENVEIELPRLAVFMSKKRPRTRMTDIHKIGSRVYFNSNADGLFGKEGTLGTFQATLKDIPDALEYQGLVVVKLPQDEPKSEEPIVFGFVKLQSARTVKVRTRQALKFGDLADEIDKITAAVNATSRRVSDAIKPLHIYRDMAQNTWVAFHKAVDDEVDYPTFLNMIDFCNIFLVNTQAQRIFQAVDVKGQSTLGISEFENFLMAYDVLEQAGKDLIVLDVYDSLKMTKNTEKFGEFGDHEGLDYSGFCEAIQVLGVKGKEDEEIIEAFCTAANVKEKDLTEAYLTLQQFKKAWLKLADVEAELVNRKLKAEHGLLAVARNRERLLRIINDQETAYRDNLTRVNEMVEKVKKDRRVKKDEKRRAAEAIREKIQRDAEKFIALRGMEKRLQLQAEQEEKSKKRVEAKVQRNKLLLRQAEAQRAKELAIAEAANKAAKLRSDQVKALGWDRMDFSVQQLREIPAKMYNTNEATTRLSCTVLADFSRNILEEIPPENFMFWMTEARKFKISQNRIREIPAELVHMAKLEILELDTNRIESLPSGLSQLTALQRLDVSNNKLQTLPEGIGRCSSLRYLYAHSNSMYVLPPSLGDCFRIEFCDLSRNKLTELPETWENMVSLTHLDVSANRLSHLPQKLGECVKLRYLDLSTNTLVFLPPTFSKLCNLEICKLENNSMLLAPNNFNNLTALKSLTMAHNQSKLIPSDIGQCSQLAYLDCSCNRITVVAPEIGLLHQLQELKLNRNELSILPPEIGVCLKLMKLDLSRNRISGDFPEEVGLLHMLRELDASYNQITNLPKSLVALSELTKIAISNCRLSKLPETITFLTKLTTLDLASNVFAKFPPQCLVMPNLSELDLACNVMTLLPRNINVVTFLRKLDLSRNMLRCVPVEFTDILESVAEVGLSGNPWGDLPPKWGRMWLGKQSTDAPLGYDVAEAVEVLYNLKEVYAIAEELWNKNGIFHFSHRMSMKDFIQHMRETMRFSWHEGLAGTVEFLYMKSRDTAMFPTLFEVSEEYVKECERLTAMADSRRAANLLMVKEEEEHRQKLRSDAYCDENVMALKERMDRVSDRLEQQRFLDESTREVAVQSLYRNVKAAEKQLSDRRDTREAYLDKVARQETQRLREYLREREQKSSFSEKKKR